MSTPTTPDGLAQYDDLPALEAVWRSWSMKGAQPEHHARMKFAVRATFSGLADILDGMALSQLLANRVDLTLNVLAAAGDLAAEWSDLRIQDKGHVRRWMPLLARALDRLADQDRAEQADGFDAGWEAGRAAYEQSFNAAHTRLATALTELKAEIIRAITPNRKDRS